MNKKKRRKNQIQNDQKVTERKWEKHKSDKLFYIFNIWFIFLLHKRMEMAKKKRKL